MKVFLVELFDESEVDAISLGVQAVCATIDAVETWARENYKDPRREFAYEQAWTIWVDDEQTMFTLLAIEKDVYGLDMMV